MRKLVLQLGMSLDGIMAGPRRVTAPHDDEVDRWKIEALRDAGAHLMGRTTYLEMAAHWPTATSDYAAPMNDIPKVVFSKTLDQADWPESRIARGDLTDEIAALKQEPGGDLIAHGGPTFAQELSRRCLVDLYRLVVLPGVLGAGSPLFADLPDAIDLELLALKRFPSGAVGLVYQPR
ncbi:MAG TPA: dihydrofolate reductase family protein [Kribbella sp.]|nr:dihydrofolate reductase family protein [Kribbella sp.]